MWRPRLIQNVLAALAVIWSAPALAAAEQSSTEGHALFARLDADADEKLTAAEVGAEHQRLFARLVRRGDRNSDNVLTREEFLLGITPDRPEKPLEEKRPSAAPQADAIRWLLVTMDTSGDTTIVEDEVPGQLLDAFESMVDRIDANKDGRLDRRELTQGNRVVAQTATRSVRQAGINATAELKKLEQKQGVRSRRFETPPRLNNMTDPSQAGQVFAQLDADGNGEISRAEVPGPLGQRFQRLLRLADGNRDGRLNEREFLAGARQLARREARRQARERPVLDAIPAEMPRGDEGSMPADEGMSTDSQ